jgi:hypothetical protein
MDIEKTGNEIESTHEGIESETEIISMPKKEYLKNQDRLISQAIKSREENIRKTFESQLRETQAKMAELEYQIKKKDLILETKDRLSEKNALDLLPLYDYDFSSIDERLKFAEKIAEIVEQKAEQKLKEKINTVKTPTNSKPAVAKNFDPAKMDGKSAKEFLKEKYNL